MCASINVYKFKIYIQNLNYMHENNVTICLISVSFWDHSLTELTKFRYWAFVSSVISHVNSHAV